MDVGLDETVAIADPYGHHGVHGDPMGGQVAGDGTITFNKRRTKEANLNIKCELTRVTCQDTSLRGNNRSTGQSLHTRCS